MSYSLGEITEDAAEHTQGTEEVHVHAKQANPSLEAGKKLPPRLSDYFPNQVAGKPLEDIDDYFEDRKVGRPQRDIFTISQRVFNAPPVVPLRPFVRSATFHPS